MPDNLEQRAFARTVMPDKTDALAPLNLKAHMAECFKLIVFQLTPELLNHVFLQAVDFVVCHAEAHGHVPDFNLSLIHI